MNLSRKILETETARRVAPCAAQHMRRIVPTCLSLLASKPAATLPNGHCGPARGRRIPGPRSRGVVPPINAPGAKTARSEEHTSELQSRGHLVCRLLLEKKK